MAEKQSILGRIAQLTRANINALLDRAEDPEKMLNQLVRDYTASIAEARDAVAQTIGNLRLAEKDHDADVAEAKDWGNKALAASRKADQLRSGGDTAGADKWDSLAKIALTKQITAENEAKAAEPMIASQRQVVEQLKTGLQQMEVKLGELRSKRDQLIARQKTAEAQVKVQGAIRSINVLDPTSELSRYEDQVRRVEAQAAGQMELAGSSLESQFAELEASGADLEAEARLAALKSGGNSALPGASSPAQITDGDDVDAAFAALHEVADGFARAVHDAVQVHLHETLPYVVVHLSDGKQVVHDAGVVHDDVHLPERLDGAVDHALHVVSVRHVHLDDVQLVSVLGQLLLERGESLLVEVGGQTACARLQEALDDALADAGSASGDDGGLT